MDMPTILDPASPQAQQVLDLFGVVLAIAGVIFAVVAGLVIAAVIRYRRCCCWA